MMGIKKIDILIVGAGPSGLAAANCCLQEGLNFEIIEQGVFASERDVNDPQDVTNGVGGAGLYCDGKLSYYPASSALWNLSSENKLHAAYNWFHNLVSDFCNEFPEYPLPFFETKDTLKKINEDIFAKEYFSFVMSNEQRNELLLRLERPLRHKIITNCTISEIATNTSGFIIKICKDDQETLFASRQIIFCGGRYGPITLRDLLPNLHFSYKKFEYGVRLEQKNNIFFLKDWPTADAKILIRSKEYDIEWRTFCCCRNGSILRSKFKNSLTYSGSSTQESEFSNIGFNARIITEDSYKEVEQEIEDILAGNLAPFSTGLDEFIQDKDKKYFGEKLDEHLKAGLMKLNQKYNIKDCNVFGPCIESVAYYPWLTSNLETEKSGLFIAGDSSGLFRGLLSSILSGYYAAKCAILRKLSSENFIKTSITINKSSISTLPLIFTAQSKKFFYCRDVICEFVFKHGMLPINPFRVFGYFLSDRVKRDIVRRGNNHLVRTCDELWVFGPISDGVLFEVIYAINMQKPIRFFSIGTSYRDIKTLTKLSDIVFEPEVHSSRQKRDNLLKEIQIAFRNYQPKQQLELFP